MVASFFSKTAGPPPGHNAGFTLSELMFSSAIFSMVSLGLLMGFTSLERNYSATTDFAVNHGDEMRISDYMAMDLRRALAVQAAQNNTSIDIPSYYDANGVPQTPTLDGRGGVIYGAAGSSVRVHYYLSAGSIYRQQGTAAAVALALNVHDFVFAVTDAGKVVTSRITFNPTFTSRRASSDATTATAFYNTTLLRNSRTDIQSGVY
ncbi:MAG: prepilin-type N-terminal cleavage/methylation domain-containing protein [Verrucomicrobiota bacterium]